PGDQARPSSGPAALHREVRSHPMEIILLERIEKLGGIGDVVTVKDGYARNYLLPNKKALRSNAANKAVFEANRAKIEADNAARRGDAESAAKTIEGVQVVLIRQSS